MNGFPLVIAYSERDMPRIEPGPLGWYTSTLTTGLQEVRLQEQYAVLFFNFMYNWMINSVFTGVEPPPNQLSTYT